MKKILLSLIVSLFIKSAIAQAVPGQTFTNPLLPSGADPWVIYHQGYYYYTNSLQNKLMIWKTKDVSQLANADKKTVWEPPAGKAYAKELWAPELHYINHKWYMYFAADDGDNNNHRMYVLENTNADPMKGQWVFKGQVGDATNKWAIDGSVFEHKGKLYMIWAGWEGDVNVQQDIYIARMKNPWTIDGSRSKISSPLFDWELHGDLPGNPSHVNVNEGPQILMHGNKVFLIYSASGCWTDFYALGMLTASANSDLTNPKSWVKSKQPVFKQAPQNGVYAPGHNSFFKSPNGKENWIIYHANSEPGQGCGNKRSPRMQRFTWKGDGTPDFGIPVKAGEPLAKPASNQ
ncbi:family 43 glycosylhydrolase [Mucilaginibacter pallidiroseus]|uniref:Family 43 glycosylhydrolase n=1 Tax=Mucilaginibacter pallidiroseus TaxID=2599295 RepID=A0A563UJB4_9SPHI|nr:glycoside hydrolase family 43 protein [Mucilaginibacter pallidiroseus]TWR31445.1 family 43 glycosylhydrolase [Mucilaginibacter pallidiroseus]